MKVLKFAIIIILVSVAGPLSAWNLGAKHVNALRFVGNGSIRFTLFNEGMSGAEFKCRTGGGGQWLTIAACSSNDGQCLASTNRMASMLLAAKLADRKVHIQRSACAVSEIALKP